MGEKIAQSSICDYLPRLGIDFFGTNTGPQKAQGLLLETGRGSSRARSKGGKLAGKMIDGADAGRRV